MRKTNFIRINTFYKELIADDRIKFDGDNYYVKNRETGMWALAKVHKGDTISAPTSRGTSCRSNIRFMLANPGPYSIEMLVKLTFEEGRIHKYFGWVKGFWTEQTRRMYFKLLLENDYPIHERYISENHNAFYKSISKYYDGKQKYRQFLINMGVNPEEVSGSKNVSMFMNQGRHIEMEIFNLLLKLSAPFEYGRRRFENKVIQIYIIKKQMRQSISKKH